MQISSASPLTHGSHPASRPTPRRPVWLLYLGWFFAGAFLANSIPHLVHGISGDVFPTPFANPPGRGASPAWLNVLWALVNLGVGSCLLVRLRRENGLGQAGWAAFALGVAVAAIALSITFTGKLTA